MQKTLLATNNSLKLLTSFFPKGGCYDFTEGVNCIENWDWRAVSFLLYPGIEIIHCSIPSATIWVWSLTKSAANVRRTCSPTGHYGNSVIHQNYLQKGLLLWELRRDRSTLTWFYTMKDWIMLFDIILVLKMYYTHKKPTHWNNTVAQKGHCRALFFIFLIKGSWMPVTLKPLQK